MRAFFVRGVGHGPRHASAVAQLGVVRRLRTSLHMSFTFEFVGARYDLGAPNSLQPTANLRLFGRLLDGCIHMGDPILIPTSTGEHLAVVSQFWDSLYDWLGMPFYETVTLATMPEPFCIVIHGFPESLHPICPGIAHSPNESSPNHALQRTGAAVTAPASTAAFPPAMQVPRRTPLSLSLGSLGDYAHHRIHSYVSNATC